MPGGAQDGSLSHARSFVLGLSGGGDGTGPAVVAKWEALDCVAMSHLVDLYRALA